MATQSVEFRAVTGQTITAKLFTSGSDTEVASVTATEATNRKGTYTAAFTDIAAGEYQLLAFNATPIPVASWLVTLTLTTATFQVYDRVDTPGITRSNWAALTVDHTSTGSVGKKLGDLPLSPAIADAVWDEPYNQHTTAGTFGKLMDILRKSNLTIEGTVSSAITPTTLTFSSNVSATTSAYAHAVLLFVSGPLTGENSPIISYNSTNGVFVLEEPLTAAPSDGDEFVVIAGSHVHSVASIQSGLATSSGVTAAFTEIKGAGWSSSTDTLKEIRDAVDEGGGGSSIMVTPVVAQTPVRVVGANIETFIGDLSDIRVGVFSGSDPVDLSGFGDLEICVQTKGGVDLDFVEMADITIDGDDNNYFSWTPSGESVSQVRSGAKWSLRKSSNKQVIAYGAWIVVDAALEDEGS